MPPQKNGDVARRTVPRSPRGRESQCAICLCNPRATRKGDTEDHEPTRDDMPMWRKPAQEIKDDISRHGTTNTLGGMESNKDLR